jgi:predicted metal-dependent phosphoesterase TrpH
MVITNPFTAPGNWYKGNLHAHTTESDGAMTPAETVALYRDAGYDFLALTDHWKVTAAAAGADGGFLLLLGVELDGDRSETGEGYHILGFGLEHAGTAPQQSTVAQAIQWIRDHGGEAVLAHPYWSGLAVADLAKWKGHLGIEVFNTVCDQMIAKGCSSVQWDDLLSRDRLTWGFAVDDCHQLQRGLHA